MQKSDTRKLILTKGLEIIHKKGFNNTGIQEILQAVNVPKGSFYFYFKSKDDFGLQLLDCYAENMFTMLEEHLNTKNLSPIERLRDFFNAFSATCKNNDFAGGCPLGNIAQEMSDLNEDFRLKLETIFNQLKNRIADILKEAQTTDQIPLSIDVYEISDFIINSWHGSIMRSKVNKNPDSLNIFDKIIFYLILNNK